ncbi:MAG: hypothetical protein KTR31_40785 [Myxococcales bacterium]|nr:hypothetical protein [Myxococcales bacterium]
MRAYVRFALPSGAHADACPGDLVGRLWTAAIRLDDPRVSEAHALVSLRGAQLKLLPLRGVLAVGGLQVTEVVLAPSTRVELAQGLVLEVLDVQLPERTPALAGLGPQPIVLASGVHSLVEGPHLIPRYLADAAAWWWSTGEGFALQVPGQSPRAVALDDQVEVMGLSLRVVEVPAELLGVPETHQRGRLHPPVHLVARYDSVQVHRSGEPVVVIGGIPARILSELVAMGGLGSWEAIATEVWSQDTHDRTLLRQRWDRNLQTLRRKIREARLRPDLVRADGHGHFELVLASGDRVTNET